MKRQDDADGGKRLWLTGAHYGDWLALDGNWPGGVYGGTDPNYIASAYYYHSTRIVAKAAHVLEYAEDAAFYDRLAEEIRAAFERAYFTPSGRLAIDTTTGCVLALYMGLAPDYAVEQVRGMLLNRLQKNFYHLDTGFTGTPCLCRVLSDLKNQGHEVILVSSGAIGMGIGKLSLKERPSDIPTKQAAAAVGQCELMYTYDKLFAEYNHTVAQILLTGSDFRHEDRYNNFQNTMRRLLELEVLPIINENDTIATEEIKVGDNDTLSAMVAVSIEADRLILLSDIDGLYTADPHKDAGATLIESVEALTPEIMALAGGEGSSLGTGGMKTKLSAAHICTETGCEMVIMNGEKPELLYDLFDGKSVGTRFLAINSRKESK